MRYLLWYGVTSLLFGIALFFPVRHFMLALNVNRHQRRLQRNVTDEERQALKKKVGVWAVLISLTFAFFYNRYLLSGLLGG